MGAVFEADADPRRIVRDLELTLGKPITPGKTLLFLDEIQTAPKAIVALRYFHELMPELHLVAAGSLLEFTIENLGLPVGRVSSLYVFPMSFVEYLAARGEQIALRGLPEMARAGSIADALHGKLLRLWGEYMAVGGMPYAVRTWLETGKLQAVADVHRSILETYRQDFGKYARRANIRHVELVFAKIPWMLGRKFKYPAISDSVKKRDLEPALDLLCKAGVAARVHHSAGQGLPLGAQIDPRRFKVLFLDIALAQVLLGLPPGDWLLDATRPCVNKGEIVEAFVGQELLTCLPPDMRPELTYWHREARSSNAEVDYLTIADNAVVPVEVKGGASGALKSLSLFLDEHPRSPFGLRFYRGKPAIEPRLKSLPLYCVSPYFMTSYDSVLQSG